MQVMKEHCYQYMAMPVDKDGNGPETDQSKVANILHEIWDEACETIATCKSRQYAERLVILLNQSEPEVT
jgi:hypothetical protein